MKICFHKLITSNLKARTSLSMFLLFLFFANLSILYIDGGKPSNVTLNLIEIEVLTDNDKTHVNTRF